MNILGTKWKTRLFALVMPILILSESASTQERMNALKYGEDDFLAMPYDLEEYLAKVQTLLRRYTELNHVAERGYAL